MKTTLFATLAAALLTATSAFAAPFNDHDRGPARPDQRFEQDPGHDRMTPQERARYEAAQRRAPRPAERFDRSQNYGFDRDHRVTREERRHWEEAHNYGYAQSHRVSPQERARWENQYR